MSEGSTVDLRKPGEEADELSEADEEATDPEDCFPEGKYHWGKTSPEMQKIQAKGADF